MDKTKEFDTAMNALLLEVDESIVEKIRAIGHEYAQQVSKDEKKQHAIEFAFAVWKNRMLVGVKNRWTRLNTYYDTWSEN